MRWRRRDGTWWVAVRWRVTPRRLRRRYHRRSASVPLRRRLTRGRSRRRSSRPSTIRSSYSLQRFGVVSTRGTSDRDDDERYRRTCCRRDDATRRCSPD